MGLFDDDFYSPKLTSWDKRRLNQGNERWPGRAWTWNRKRLALLAFVSAAGLLLLAGIGIQWRGAENEGEPEIPVEKTAAVLSENIQMLGVVDIVELLKPSIVSVIRIQQYPAGKNESADQESGVGSGIIYKKEGNAAKVVTNHHVIEGAERMDVVFSDGQRVGAKLVGSDALTDLAVLEIDADYVTAVAEFGDSDFVKEGEAALAIGHPFGLGYSPSFTLGIISSLQRIIPISLAMDGTIDWEMELLQTDAAINHGNSGGALVNRDGKVIGINSMKVAKPGVEGLGFAIPSNTAEPIIQELELYGKVRRPYLGVATIDVPQYRRSYSDRNIDMPESLEEGLVVLETYGPASEAGIRTNDVIVALDGRPVVNNLGLRKYLYENKKIGDPITVEFYRGNKKDSVIARLSETPDS